MKTLRVMVGILLLATFGYSSDNPYIVKQYVAYLEANDQPTEPLPFRIVSDDGGVRLEYWGAAVPAPAESQLTAPAVLDLPKKYRKRNGVKWIEMTPAEKSDVDLAEVSGITTNDATLMSLVEIINESKGSGAKDITVSNLVARIKSKKK